LSINNFQKKKPLKPANNQRSSLIISRFYGTILSYESVMKVVF